MRKRKGGARRARPLPFQEHGDGGQTQATLGNKEDAESVRSKLRSLIRSESVAMVRSVLDNAKAGQYQSIKYLFEMAGIYPATVAEHEKEDELSLVRILCNRLGLPELEESQVEQLKPDATAENADAVE